MNLNSDDPVQWLNSPDIRQAHTLKHWLEEDLQISINQVLSINVQSDMIEQAPEGQYKRFEPGKFNVFVITLLDGNKLYRSFRRGNDM